MPSRALVFACVIGVATPFALHRCWLLRKSRTVPLRIEEQVDENLSDIDHFIDKQVVARDCLVEIHIDHPICDLCRTPQLETEGSSVDVTDMNQHVDDDVSSKDFYPKVVRYMECDDRCRTKTSVLVHPETADEPSPLPIRVFKPRLRKLYVHKVVDILRVEFGWIECTVLNERMIHKRGCRIMSSHGLRPTDVVRSIVQVINIFFTPDRYLLEMTDYRMSRNRERRAQLISAPRGVWWWMALGHFTSDPRAAAP